MAYPVKFRYRSNGAKAISFDKKVDLESLIQKMVSEVRIDKWLFFLFFEFCIVFFLSRTCLAPLVWFSFSPTKLNHQRVQKDPEKGPKSARQKDLFLCFTGEVQGHVGTGDP